MARRRLLVDDATLLRLAQAGYTQEQIAECSKTVTGRTVSRSTVAVHFSRMGWSTEQPSHRDLIPWTVREEHQRAYAIRMLRVASRQRQGLPVSSTDAQRTQSFFGALIDAGRAIAYGPDLNTPFWAIPTEDPGITVSGLLTTDPPKGVPAFTRALKGLPKRHL